MTSEMQPKVTTTAGAGLQKTVNNRCFQATQAADTPGKVSSPAPRRKLSWSCPVMQVVLFGHADLKRLAGMKLGTLEDAAGEQGMRVAAPAIKDVVIIPHHDLRYAGKGVRHVLAAPVLTIMGEVEEGCLLRHVLGPLC